MTITSYYVSCYGINGNTLQLLKSYLTDKTQRCYVNGVLTTEQYLSCGIPQGSIRGPLLFIIYINDFPKCLRHTTPGMFADNNNCPTYLQERFHRTSEIHDYNLRGSNYDLQLPLPKTNFLKRSFSYRGAMAWNQLSNKTREMGDLISFKLAIS